MLSTVVVVHFLIVALLSGCARAGRDECSGFSVKQDYQYASDEPPFNALSGSSPSDCCSACSLDPKCTGFALDNGRCLLKTAIPGSLTQSNGITAGVRLHKAGSVPRAPVLERGLAGAGTDLAYKYVGCFNDQFQSPDLPVYVNGTARLVNSCASACNTRNFRYFGLQNGGDCYCGNSYGRYGASTLCALTCNGGLMNMGQACGGFQTNSIYEIVNPPPPADCPALQSVTVPYSSRYLVDGDLNTYSFVISNLVVDFGAPTVIKNVVVTSRRDVPQTSLGTFWAFFSEFDPSPYSVSQLLTYVSYHNGSVYAQQHCYKEADANSQIQITLSPPVTMRYVKIFPVQYSILYLAEFSLNCAPMRCVPRVGPCDTQAVNFTCAPDPAPPSSTPNAVTSEESAVLEHAPVVGGLAGFVVLAVGVLILVIVVRRRCHRRKAYQKPTDDAPAKLTHADESFGTSPFYDHHNVAFVQPVHQGQVAVVPLMHVQQPVVFNTFNRSINSGAAPAFMSAPFGTSYVQLDVNSPQQGQWAAPGNTRGQR